VAAGRSPATHLLLPPARLATSTAASCGGLLAYTGADRRGRANQMGEESFNSDLTSWIRLARVRRAPSRTCLTITPLTMPLYRIYAITGAVTLSIHRPQRICDDTADSRPQSGPDGLNGRHCTTSFLIRTLTGALDPLSPGDHDDSHSDHVPQYRRCGSSACRTRHCAPIATTCTRRNMGQDPCILPRRRRSALGP
jgi:hypothetical protein